MSVVLQLYMVERAERPAPVPDIQVNDDSINEARIPAFLLGAMLEELMLHAVRTNNMYYSYSRNSEMQMQWHFDRIALLLRIQ